MTEVDTGFKSASAPIDRDVKVTPKGVRYIGKTMCERAPHFLVHS